MGSSKSPESLTRRTVLKIGAVLTGSEVISNLIPIVARAQETPAEGEIVAKTDYFKSEIKRIGFSEEDLGKIASKAYRYNGMWYMCCQGGVLQDNPQLGTVLANSMQDLHEAGYDDILEALYQIPPQIDWDDHATDTDDSFRKRAIHFEWLPRLVNWFQDKRSRFETGVPQSYGVSKDRQGNPWPFSSYRTQRYVGQDWGDRIERILVGNIFINVGREIDGKFIPGEKIVPDYALLDKPEDLPTTQTTTQITTPTSPPAVVGKDTLSPNTVEGLLQIAQITGQAKASDGTVVVDTRKTPSASLTPTVNPDTSTKLANTVQADGKTHNGLFTTGHVVVLGSVAELPIDIPLINGLRTIESNINMGLYRGTGGFGPFVYTGEFTFFIQNGKAVLFYIPAPGLNLSDPAIQRGVNEVITLRLLESTASGQNFIGGALQGKNEHLGLVRNQAVQLS